MFQHTIIMYNRYKTFKNEEIDDLLDGIRHASSRGM